MSAIPPAATPPAGWYPEPNEPSVIRYWDGSQWTSHLQPSPAALATIEGARISNRMAAGIVLALIAVLTVIFVAFGGEGNGGSASLTEQQALSLDAEAKAGVRTVQTAIETYSTDHDGTYAGATPDELRMIESTIPEEVTVTADTAAYSLAVRSVTGTSFGIARDANGQVSYSCDTPGTGGCPDTGNWAAP